MRAAGRVLPFLLMLGCGGAAKPVAKTPDPVKDPIPKTVGPPCDKVGARVAQIASAGNLADGRAAKFFTTRCTSDAWSDEVRSCFAAIENDAESEGCISKLTDAQRDAMAKAASALPAEPAASVAPPPPPSAPAPRTRGPVKKEPKGGVDDPCHGGE